ncbi:MAG TPA: hypothetical protein P5555_20140 [Candidatus Paceibacterota bacterium]|nr:hypothetical protein [Verrucomicrobiota bacterium]HRZ47494.1 hypothetical protein [Candidatus Paceibacterota bacterium]HSA01905.1 hypothetical protein [Candidatus Paceibacterota bacterium]
MSQELGFELCEKLDRALAALRPSKEDVRARHGHLLAQWRREREGSAAGSLAQRVYELWQGFKIRVSAGMEELEAGLAAPAMASDRAMRGTGEGASGGALAGETGGIRQRMFIRPGVRCVGMLGIEVQADRRLKFSMTLLDEERRPLKPFRLTVWAAGGGTVGGPRIVEGERYSAGDVSPGRYRIRLETLDGQCHVEMEADAAGA